MEGTSRALPYTIKSINLLGSHALGGNPIFMEYIVSSTYCKYFEMNHVVEAFIVLPGGVDTIKDDAVRHELDCAQTPCPSMIIPTSESSKDVISLEVHALMEKAEN
ncbi:hypothetical protein DM860_014410 [Cuscuta australis]|uniref:Cytokinin riboside 5'-monophosphate phosphoribohydrolase n=1 Tax=Cuscuta australis TaxID=267555 RepID=A0A328DU20_9ASTE|nr:hypothetical protein DM860_014410 [Cuscuta australis]